MASKPWRLSSSVIILAPHGSVPDCEFSDLAQGASQYDYRICMVKRAAQSSFMPDAMVFPGGAVDSEDVQSAKVLLGSSDDDLDAIVRCAAVREVLEESGIGIFQHELQLSSGDLMAWRKKVHDRASEFRSLCATHCTSPDVNSLQYWCSFVTPDMEHKRLKRGGFDARFFIWCAQTESQLAGALADAQETVSLVWLTPNEVLAATDAGRIAVAPPQWYIVKELADYCPKLADAAQYAASPGRALRRDYPIKPYPVMPTPDEQTAIIARLGVPAVRGSKDAVEKNTQKKPPVIILVFPGDQAHPIFPGAQGARHRLLIVGTFGGTSKFDLQLDMARIDLPLREAQTDWYSLAKL